MATSSLVPGLLPVAVNGHPFLADAQYQRETVQVMRQQADTSFEPGEASLNPAGLWRRSQESWHHGAGQEFLDGRKGLSSYSQVSQDPERFRSSKGVDVWTKGQVSLLHPTIKAWSTANTNLHLATVSVASVFVVYVSDGTELYFAWLPFGGFNSLALESGTGWTATNATVNAGSNITRFNITATAGAVVTVTSPTGTSGVPVEAGRSYSLNFWSLYVSGGAAKTATAFITWYNAAGATISSSATFTAPATDTGSGAAATGTATAPAGAAFASVTGSWTAAWAINEVHRVYSIQLAPADDTGTNPPDNWKAAGINAGQATQTVQSITSDGTNVWAAYGTSGLHRTSGILEASTADVPAAPASGQISLVGYANGFLLAAGSAGVTSTLQNSLWLVTDPLGTPALSLIKTHPNTNFVWTGIGPGRSCVYAWGNSGGNGEVYKVLFDPNTGSLSTAASPATYLPDGETIHALQFYAGGILMGTGRGVRIGTADGAGNIDYGPLIPTDWPVRCLEPQGRYCWFGWTKYDSSTSGLGRIDLGFLTDTLTPAWASDLMTADSSTGDVVDCVTMAPYGYTASQRPPVRVFTVAGKGVYIEDPGSRELTGQLLTGTIRFSTSEPKTTRSLDVRHHALPTGGPVTAEMQRDTSGTWTSVGSSSVAGSYGPAAPLDLQNLAAEAMEFRFTLTRPTAAGTDFTQSPELTRWTAKVLPTPSTIDETFTFTLHMHETVDTTAADGQPYRMDVPAEITYLKGLERTRTLIDIQIGSETISNCYVVGSKFVGDHWNGPKREFAEGKLELQIQTARG